MKHRSRSIVVAIGDQGALPVLEWVAALARAGDRVRVVHVFEPMPYTTVDWQLPVDNAAVVYPAAARHTADAARRLRNRRPDLEVDAEIVRCAADDGLLAASAKAQLLVLGSPHHAGSFRTLAHLTQRAACPVLVVGDQHPPAAPTRNPITVLLRDRPGDDELLATAFTEAIERRCGLVVLRSWRPTAEVGLVYAEIEEQKSIDELLIGWTERYPQVGVSVELRLGDLADVLRAHASDDAMLIMSGESGPSEAQPVLNPTILEVLQVRAGPILLVPLRGRVTPPSEHDHHARFPAVRVDRSALTGSATLR